MGDKEKGRNGEGRDISIPRPLLEGLSCRAIQELILDNSWKLADSSILCGVSVVRDLTARQRVRKHEMGSEATKSNLERQQEDIEGNLAFKVIGKRGEKRVINAPLRKGEVVNELGEV